jgi:uncharacterized membrane protein YdbT with pleckstrin-like domain
MNEIADAIIYQGRPSWLNYIGFYLIGLVLLVLSISARNISAGLFLLLSCVGSAAISRYRYQFTVTNDSIITRVGLIAKNTNEMQLRHIRAINVRQGIIERILGIGTVIFISAAESEAAVIFKGISEPYGVKERIRSLG